MAKWPEGSILFAARTTPLWISHAYDKEQRVERLKKRYVKGTLTKADVNKQGYNKFLSVSSGVTIHIDETKIKEDRVWNDLKGHRSNTGLRPEEVYDAYQNLWNVELSFRIIKGMLEVRPMFPFYIEKE